MSYWMKQPKPYNPPLIDPMGVDAMLRRRMQQAIDPDYLFRLKMQDLLDSSHKERRDMEKKMGIIKQPKQK